MPDKFVIRLYNENDRQQVIELWNECLLLVPQNDPVKDIRLKTAFQPELFFVGCTGKRIIASLMAGYEGHRGWLNYLAVHPVYRKQGIGRAIVFHALEQLKALGCPKVNLQVRNFNSGVIEFYKKLGFAIDDVMSMGLRF